MERSEKYTSLYAGGKSDTPRQIEKPGVLLIVACLQ
jgi:hypothetical protein